MSKVFILSNPKIDYINQQYSGFKNGKIPDDCIDTLNYIDFMTNKKLYNKLILGKFERKEEIEMIESLNILNLYFDTKKEKIYKEANNKILDIRKNNETIKKVDEIMKNAERELNDLYLSQLDEEDLENIKNGKRVNRDKYPFIRDNEIILSYDGCYRNQMFMNNEIKTIQETSNKKIDELNELCKLVKTHIGIAKTKEEVEEILIRYDILDKKGKLVI